MTRGLAAHCILQFLKYQNIAHGTLDLLKTLCTPALSLHFCTLSGCVQGRRRIFEGGVLASRKKWGVHLIGGTKSPV